jgi:hypothetical protein
MGRADDVGSQFRQESGEIKCDYGFVFDEQDPPT